MTSLPSDLLTEDEIPSALYEAYKIDSEREFDRPSKSFPRVHISRHNPRRTHRADTERHRAIEAGLEPWAKNWWQERGYELVALEQNGERVFSLRKPAPRLTAPSPSV